jgi:hypothetical protein
VIARRVILENGARLERALLRERLREIEREMRAADSSGDFAKAMALAGEAKRLNADLRAAERRLQSDSN